MTRLVGRFVWVLILGTTLLGCAPDNRPGNGPGDDDDDPAADASEVDAPPGFIDATPLPTPDADMSTIPDAASGTGGADGGCAAASCPSPVGDGCKATETCNNGLDDNCNGQIDEGCSCQPGAVQPCFGGKPGHRNVGACQDGTQRCEGSGEFGSWGACMGGIVPGAEACDSLDNDCNGCVDDDPQCCTVELACPSTMPEGSPFTDYVIDGTMFFAGPVSSWTWTVTGGPCDVLLAPNVSFTLNGAKTVTVTGATASTLTFRPTLSGDYTVNVKMTLPDGTVQECTFIVHVRGPGLRVEMCWDQTGLTDVDLHLHKPGTATPWFTTDGSTTGPENAADCHYMNCKGSGWNADWGYGTSPLAECSGGPEGFWWTLMGHCKNPRLDIDNIFTTGQPENINVDRPENGKSYRVAVHYYSGSAPVKPLVNVYCGGSLKATYGAAPDLVPGFASGGPNHAEGPIWRVVDVTPQVNGAGDTTGCSLAPVHAPGQASGYYVTCPKPGSATNCSNLVY